MAVIEAPLETRPPQPPARPAPRIAASAALELHSLTYSLHAGQDLTPVLPDVARRRRVLSFQPRVATFWTDDCRGFDELLIAAERLDVLTGSDLMPLLSSPPASAFDPLGVSLDSESAADRIALLARLDRLQREPALRRRWAALLKELWTAVESSWQAEGLHRVQSFTEHLRERQARTPSTLELLRGHTKLEKLQPLLERGEMDQERATLLVPSHLQTCCLLVFSLRSTWLIGFPVTPVLAATDLRGRAEETAARVKALADPSRLALLTYLARQPATIGVLTGAFGLAQPTVSNHVRILRQAELVRPLREGGSTRYTVDQAELDGLLADLRSALLPDRNPDQ